VIAHQIKRQRATQATSKIQSYVYANAQTIFAAKATIAATSGVDYLTPRYERRAIMLYTIAVVLVVLWALGLVSAYTMGGFIHVLLVLAIILVLLRLINGRTLV
jgi:Family of unknown function (DUF5670)